MNEKEKTPDLNGLLFSSEIKNNSVMLHQVFPSCRLVDLKSEMKIVKLVMRLK